MRDTLTVFLMPLSTMCQVLYLAATQTWNVTEDNNEVNFQSAV